MSLSKHLLIAALCGLASTAQAYDLEHDWLPKVNAECGAQFAFKYDTDSLKKTNKDIGYGQTDGDNECGEPLRYLWYACKTPAGLAAVKRARIKQVVCQGTAGAKGALTLSSGALTAERAYQESSAFLRSRKQFEAALKVSLSLGSADPYRDEAWHGLASQPNPVTSVTTYCLVDGNKVEYDEHADSQIVYRREGGSVKCWKDGQVTADLAIRTGKRTGFTTWSRDALVQRESYRDGEKDGEQRRTENGVVTELELYDNGKEVWSKSFYPDGKLKDYSRSRPSRLRLGLGKDGKLLALQCAPAAREDELLREYCGFNGPATHSIYDGTGKVSKTVTFANGVLQKQGAGNSQYASGSEVAYVDGKKHGAEKVTGPDGKLQSVTTWNHGARDGLERFYDDDGKKVIEEVVWKADVQQRVTDYYLNGNQKLEEVFDSPTQMKAKKYWDNGKLAEEGALLRCEVSFFGYRFRDWCEEGPYRTFYESGARDSEGNFHEGRLEGEQKSWWESGRPASIEQYEKGRLMKAKEWDKDGKLKTDEEYEADGSRKLR